MNGKKKERLTLASDFTLANTVHITTLLLLVVLRLSRRAFCRARKCLRLAFPASFALSSFLSGCRRLQDFIVGRSRFVLASIIVAFITVVLIALVGGLNKDGHFHGQ